MLLAFVGWAAVLPAQRHLNLDSCRSLAVANNKGLLVSREKMQKAEYDRKAARANFLPDFSATGTYLYFSDEVSLLSREQQSALNTMGTSFLQGFTQAAAPVIEHIAQADPQLAQALQQAMQGGSLDGIAEALDRMGNELTNAFRTDTRHIWAGAVTVAQPLYMGGRIRAYHRISKSAEALARTQYEARLQDIILETDEAYWTVVSLSHKQKLAESFRALVGRLDSDVERMIEEGVATKADGLTVKVKVNEADMALTKVENGLALARMVLCQLCGLPLDTPLVLSDELQEGPVTAGQDTDEAVRRAFAYRPELRGLDWTNRIYEDKVRMARSEMLPSLALTGGYLVSNPSLLDGFENKFRGMWNVGVMLQVPLFHWGEGMYKVKAARSEAHIAQLQLADVQEKIELQVHQGLFRNSEAQKSLSLAVRNMEKAEENLRYADKGFREGVIPVADVMEAQTAWLSARADQIDAQIDLRLAQTYLQKAMGTLGTER